MRIILFAISMFACVIGTAIFLFTFSGMSAVQQTSGIAIACAVVIIPYVLARSYQEIWRMRWEEKLPERIAAALREPNPRQ